MQILLFILKIIGIILLVLLGLILLVLFMLLFVPIRYEINGKIEDEHKIEAGGVIRYLFSILKLTVAYRNGELETDVYLFGFRKKKSVLDESEPVSDKDNQKEAEIVNDVEVIEKAEVMKEAESEEFKSEAEIVVSEDFENVEENVATKEQQTVSEGTRTKKNTQLKKENRKPKKKTKTVKQNKKDENKFPIELIKKELTDQHNHNVLRKICRELKYLISHFGFRKIKTDLCFGAGDPALTGQILGILAMFPILYHYEFGIVPDFETEDAYVKGSFAVVGRIRLIHVLVTAGRLIFDKEVQMVIKKFMGILNQ